MRGFMRSKFNLVCVVLTLLSFAFVVGCNVVEANAIEKPVQIDVSAIESWGAGETTSVTMMGAEVSRYEGNSTFIVTEDGNEWELENFYLEPEDYLLVWFDTTDCASVEEWEIIKLWVEVH